jgi:2-polyprenyl-3-methyl-5-hydroxy-6-metoxy-1,4-benzoquinol methylase
MENLTNENPSLREGYREKLRQVFNYYLKKQIGTDPKRILSVGCMFGLEAEPLLKTFPGANYKGIDIDREIIGAATRMNKDLTRAEFQLADAREMEAFGIEPYDIVVVRHPQVLGDLNPGSNLAKDWHTILQNSMAALRPNGALFVSTTDEDCEGNCVLDYIRHSREKMTVVISDENKFAYGSWPFKDNFIIIAKKAGEQKI